MTTPRRALVVVDVQREYFDGPLQIRYPPIDAALDAIIATITTARKSGLPTALIQHENPPGSAAFAAGSRGQQLHPRVAAMSQLSAPSESRDLPVFTKNRPSIFSSPEFVQWLARRNVDTITLVGFMTNNCLLASASAGDPAGIAIEVLRDASGAISLANDAGAVPAQRLHEDLMVVLHSNWAAVSDTHRWARAVAESLPLSKSNLIASANSNQPDVGRCH
ncbi:MAG: isochorismatase family protein [Actinomycetaceae bacterium]|nr:isochorismatase family protein [Actinomycetaceae bacterium]